MKEVAEYKRPITIYLVPNLRNGNSLRVEFNIIFNEVVFKSTFDSTLSKLRKLGFSCTPTIGHSNSTEESNIIDIALDLCTDEREVVPDLVKYLEIMTFEGSVLDRTRTTMKKENNKMKT
jgi:hypothetical protein